MKKFVLALALALGGHIVGADATKPETKRVCVDVKDKQGQDVIDPKTKKVKQNCKEIKQHKKLEVEKK